MFSDHNEITSITERFLKNSLNIWKLKNALENISQKNNQNGTCKEFTLDENENTIY